VIAGCDGFHGVCRPSIPDDVLTVYERVYPFAWLGILAEVAPSSDELIYCHHDRGFALHSMRSPQLSRLYLQVAPDEDVDEWPDERVWGELRTRLATAHGDRTGLDAYSETCLRRVWRVQHFSWWMTSMLHRLSDDSFEPKLQRAQLDYVCRSRAAATTLAENYVGLERV